MREIMEWVDREVEQLECEIEGEAMEGDKQIPLPDLLKAALRDCV